MMNDDDDETYTVIMVILAWEYSRYTGHSVSVSSFG